jgi:hypothetical protein
MPSTPDCFDDTLSNPHFAVDWGQGSVETARCASAQRVEATIPLLDAELQEVSPVLWPSTRIISLSGFDIHRGFESPLYVTPCSTERHTHSPTHTNTHTHTSRIYASMTSSLAHPESDLLPKAMIRHEEDRTRFPRSSVLSCFMSPYSRNLQ